MFSKRNSPFLNLYLFLSILHSIFLPPNFDLLGQKLKDTIPVSPRFMQSQTLQQNHSIRMFRRMPPDVGKAGDKLSSWYHHKSPWVMTKSSSSVDMSPPAESVVKCHWGVRPPVWHGTRGNRYYVTLQATRAGRAHSRFRLMSL